MRLRLPTLALLLLLALVSAAEAKVPRTLKVRFPRTVIAAGANVEMCAFVRLPVTEPFDVASYKIDQRGFSGTGIAINHFLVYLYTGERLDDFATQQNSVFTSRGCLDLGPSDRDSRQMVALTRTITSRGILPSGLSMPLVPVPATPGAPPAGIGLLMDANWINGATKSRKVSATVTFTAAKRGTVRRRLQTIFAREAEQGIDVPPFSFGATESLVDARWHPPTDVCLYDVTDHMHRRGKFFGVEIRDASDQPRQPLNGLANPYANDRPTLFGAPDYTDPGSQRFPGGLFVGAAESLRYGCWHDNGETEPVRLGCQETPGIVPGSMGSPAAECTPGCTCVPANLVAGPTPDDEVCTLAGFYYDAAPGVSCDLSSLPPIN
jgi:hypothetical protein